MIDYLIEILEDYRQYIKDDKTLDADSKRIRRQSAKSMIGLLKILRGVVNWSYKRMVKRMRGR